MPDTVSANRIEKVRKAAEGWRKDLVDTSGRNRLRNYRHLKTGTLDLTPDNGNGLDADALDRLLTGRTVSLGALFPNGFDDAFRRVSAIRRNARSDLEEKGIDTLFAAVGLATWKVEPGVTPPNAPVLLAPLEIKSVGKHRFSLSISGDIILNPVLTYILERDHGVDAKPISQRIADAQDADDPLAEFASYDKLEGWLTHIKNSWSVWMEQSIKAIRHHTIPWSKWSAWIEQQSATEWRIEPCMVVGIFRYASQAMVEDLKEHCEQFAKNDLVAAIAGDPGAQDALKATICDPDPTYDQPDRDPPVAEFLVLDADASQHRAINRVLGGESLVIQGPPGTGKSQTIANLIATLMADGKRVLFVAEKRAAIEAVTKRLRGDDVGLADLVMDCHGGIRGEHLAQTLKKGLAVAMGASLPADNDLRPDLERRRNTLAEHHAALHRKRDPWGLCVFHLEERLLGIPPEAHTTVRLSDAANGITSVRFKHLKRAIGNWVKLGGHDLASDHPEWSRSAITTSGEARSAFDLASNLNETYLPEARDAIFGALDAAGLVRPATLAEWRELLEFMSGVERMLARCLPDVYRLDHAKVRQSLAPSGTVAAQALRHLSEGAAAEERDALELAVRLADELLPPAREALERTLGEVGGKLPDTVGEWREMVEFLLAIERMLTRCVADAYRLDHTALRESLTVGIGMAGRVTAQLSIKAPGERREGHELAVRMASLLPDARDALFAALDEIGLTRPKMIGEWKDLVGLLSDIQSMQEKCPSDIYRVGQIERKKMLPPYASRLMGILKSIFSGGYRDERKVREDMMRDMVRHDEAWARWSTDGLHPRLPAGLDDVKERIAALVDIASRFQRLITTDTFADVEHDALLDALLRVNGYWNAREALRAALREPEDLSDPDALGLLDEVEGQIGEWGQRVGDGLPRVPHALAEANERLVALTNGLAAFTRMASAPSLDQVPYDNVLGTLETLREHWATREAIAEMLHAPGYLSATGALDLVREAGVQLDEWRRRRVDGGEPRVPDGLDAARERVGMLGRELDAFGATIRDNGLHDRDIDDLAELLERLSTGASREALIRLPDIRAPEKEFHEAGFTAILNRVGKDILPEYAAQSVEYAWLKSVRNTIDFDDPRFITFNSDDHSNIRKEFIDFDKKHIRTNSQRVKHYVANAARSALFQHPREEKIVTREANKTRRLKPVRRLFREAPNVLTALFPCWTMSPILVAEMIPPDLELFDRNLFDVVIFDEASQIQPAEAIGSLARAPQAVIAGDDRQLPPTRFFGLVAGDSDDDDADSDDDVMQGMASILAVAKTIALRDQMLQWHYRSRDARLIAFSNEHLYGKNLTIFPGTLDAVPVIHHREEREVEAVVNLVLDHARERPDKTLGVIAFGQPHATAIETALANLQGDDSTLLVAFEAKADEAGERFFVKNIERVQGDERDAIILSVGYSNWQANGKIAHNFGPINQQGGERRLNVAITRARERMTLVSTFDHRDMNPRPHKAQGVDLLHQYFEYVASGCENAGSPPPEMNLFERSVADGLERRGISFVPQYGVSGYRIDFACQHPKQPGRMVLAIEADGASIHSRTTVRERDRLRQRVLEGMGWRFHRIWSTNWFRDPEAELDKAVAAYWEAVEDADRQARR